MHHFHLQTVLDNRLLREQNVIEQHAGIKRRLGEQIGRLRTIEAQRAERMLLLKNMKGQEVPVQNLESLWGEIGILFQRQVELEKLIAETEVDLETKRQQLLEARKDRKLLEILKEKRLAEFLEASARKDAKTADEIGVQRYQGRER